MSLTPSEVVLPTVERKHPLAVCEQCTLYSEDYVPSEGSEDAEIAVLAEAPGFEETKQRRPLVGQSGKLLEPVLKHHGLLRKDLLITNSCLCRPPENRNPSKLELECCRPRLEHELRNAKTVIAFGNFAAQAVLKTKDGITKLRVGPPKTTESGLRVVPTFHPAACLRNPGFFPQLVTDVGKVHVLERAPVKPPTYRVFEDPRQAAQALQQLQRYPKVVLDIETGLEKDTDFDHANELLCVGFSYAPGKAIVITDAALESFSTRKELAKVLSACKLTAHNCFSGDTKFLTPEGLVSLQESVGNIVEVWTRNGWQKGEVNYYGNDKLIEIELSPYNRSRSSLRHQILATANHRWHLCRAKKSKWSEEFVARTDELRIGDRIAAELPKITPNESGEAFIHGVLFADGSLTTSQGSYDYTHQIRLCGWKAQFANLFPALTYPTSAKGDPVCNSYHYKYNCKELPPEGVNAQYIADFVHGWQLMDGTETSAPNSFTRVVQTIDKEAADWLVHNSVSAGWFCSGQSVYLHKNSFNPNGCELHTIVLTKDPTMGWSVKSIKELEEPQPVFCVEVPTEGSFTLAGGVYTSNSKFDLPGLWPIGPSECSEDTMLSSYAQNEISGVHGLKYRAREELGYPEWEAAIAKEKKGAGFAAIERNLLYEYNAWDCCATWDLEELDAGRMNTTQQGLYRHLIDISNALMPIEMGGVRVDEVYLDQLSTELVAKLEEMETGLSRWVENPRSPVQVKAALGKLGCRAKDTAVETLKVKIGKGSTPAEASAFIAQLLNYRKDFKTYSTYVEGARKRMRNGRIFPTYLIHGTTTGRLSCRNPNLQNLTRGSVVRNLYVPNEGNVFIAADYKAIELRVEACLARDQNLADIFNSGADPHNIFAEMVFGQQWTDPQRSIAKTCCAVGTLVLTNKLEWVPVESLQEGEDILAFTENRKEGKGRAGTRRWESGKVLRSEIHSRPCLEVTLSNGDSITVTEDHKFLTPIQKGLTHADWVEVRNLSVGSILPKYSGVWSNHRDYESGWMAGFLDGEGYIIGKGHGVGFNQKIGPVWDRASKWLLENGAPQTVQRVHSKGMLEGQSNGGRAKVAELIGSIGSTRMINNFITKVQGTMLEAKEWPTIVSITPVGLKQVAVVETSTRTLITNGYASHNCVYGGAYGEDPRSMANRIGISLDLAMKLNRKLRSFMPDVNRYQADVKKRVLAGEDLTTPFGRTQHNYLITDKNAKDIVKQSWAFEPQSIANDINLSALVQLVRDGLTIRTTTHDSIMAECPREQAKEVGDHMRQVMERTAKEAYSDFVPFPVDVKVGNTWGEV